MKPSGVVMTFDARSGLGLRVTQPTAVEDAIWRAVEAGCSPDRFRQEVWESWEHAAIERAKDERSRIAHAFGRRQ